MMALARRAMEQRVGVAWVLFPSVLINIPTVFRLSLLLEPIPSYKLNLLLNPNP